MRLIAACSAILAGLALGVVHPLAVGPSGVVAGALALEALAAALAWARAWRRPAREAAPGRVAALGVLAGASGLAALVALGAWWASLRLARPEADPLAEQARRRARVVVVGAVAAPPVHAGATARLVVAADSLASDGSGGLAPDGGGAGLAARANVQPRRLEPAITLQVVDWWDGPAGRLVVGDRVQLDGRLSPAPPTGSRHELLFPRTLGLLAPADQADPRAVAYRLRQAAMRTLQARLPEPEASLAAGLLLGAPAPQDPEFRQQLQRSGLSHLLAVDGYKQVLVAGVLQAIWVRLLGRWRAVPLVLLGIGAYTLLTGASPSAVRAGLMLGLSLLASLVGRVHDPLGGLLLAASLMGVVQPELLLELAFQLSFAATLGLVLFYPRLRYTLRRLPRPIAEPAGLTLAVTVATLPVTLVVFQQVSLVSPAAHIVAVPLVPPVLLATALLLLVSQPFASSLAGQPFASSPAGQPLAFWLVGAASELCWLATHLLAQVIRAFGSLPGAAISTGRLPPLAAAGLAVGLLAWGVWVLPDSLTFRRRLRRKLAESESYQVVRTPLAIMLAGLLSTALILLVRPDGRVHISRLRLTRGAAALVRGPNGTTALVVSGAVNPRELAEGVREDLALWERSLDLALVVDPADAPRLEQVLQAYPARQLASADQDRRFDLGRGAVLDVFGPPAAAVRLSYGKLSRSLPDASGEAGPLLQPDEDEQIEHDREEHDDQLHALADDHAG